MSRELKGQTSFADFLGMEFGKMSPAQCQATEEKISEPCWKSLQGSQSREFQFLSVMGGGSPPDLSRATDGKSLGEYTTRSIGALHSDVEELPLLSISMGTMRLPSFLTTVECGEAPGDGKITVKLSEILEQNPDKKYDLSKAAIRGIIRRQKEKNKDIPPELLAAMVWQMEHG